MSQQPIRPTPKMSTGEEGWLVLWGKNQVTGSWEYLRKGTEEMLKEWMPHFKEYAELVIAKRPPKYKSWI